MDDAVWDAGSELPRTWQELQYPAGHPYHAPGSELDRPGLCPDVPGSARAAGLGRRAGRPVIAGYPTLALNNGARHVIGGPWLGDATDKPDAEPDGQPHPQALGDDLSPTTSDDEDGVVDPAAGRWARRTTCPSRCRRCPTGRPTSTAGSTSTETAPGRPASSSSAAGSAPASTRGRSRRRRRRVLGQTFARVRINSRGPLGADRPGGGRRGRRSRGAAGGPAGEHQVGAAARSVAQRDRRPGRRPAGRGRRLRVPRDQPADRRAPVGFVEGRSAGPDREHPLEHPRATTRWGRTARIRTTRSRSRSPTSCGRWTWVPASSRREAVLHAARARRVLVGPADRRTAGRRRPPRVADRHPDRPGRGLPADRDGAAAA